jgi:uncharacterized protein YbaR (Trm112 family)/SAM-dependent methyltransferase
MKYNALDFMSCPIDKHFPLKLYAAKLGNDSTSCQKFYDCQQYCGYFEQSIASATPSESDCEQCYSKTIEEGVLFCEQCGSLYLITKGIPKLIPEELKSREEIQLLEEIRSQLGLRRNITANRTVDSFVLKGKRNEMASRGKYEKDEIIASHASKRFDFMNRVEFNVVAKHLDVKDSDRILDAGAGYGVMSIPISRRCRYLVSTDITFEVLTAFREFFYGISTSYFNGYKEFPEGKICLIQADMCFPPFRGGFEFNRVVSTQVVCQIPGEEEKESFIGGVCNHLEPGGIFVVTALNYSLYRRLMRLIRKTPKEAILEPAEWAGYYYRFRRDEFRELLATHFVVEKLFGFGSLPPRYIAPVNMGLANFLEGMAQVPPISFLLGEILLAKCHKRI